MRYRRMVWCGVLLVAASFAVRAPGMMISVDPSPIQDPAQRDKVSAALDTLAKDPADLPALEVILQTLPQVVDTVGISAFYNFSDPLKTQVCAVIQKPASVDMLAQALNKGSDLAARWACRRIANQAYNSDSPVVQGVKGVIDAAAQAKLKGLLQDQFKRKDGTVRAAAVTALAPMIARADRPGILKPLLKDEDVRVESAVVQELWQAGSFDPDVEAAVGGFLEKGDQDLLSSCCWWWSMRARSNTAMTVKQEAVFLRLGGDPRPEVRRRVADAMGEYATPTHAALANMLLTMADSDADEEVRSNAVFALRNFRTPEVHEKLLEWSEEGQPQLVRQNAQRLLKEYRW